VADEFDRQIFERVKLPQPRLRERRAAPNVPLVAPAAQMDNSSNKSSFPAGRWKIHF
jgi:hypothetical protein